MFNNFSPNMLKTYNVCPKKFMFKFVKKISMPVNDEIFETGKNIHALASYYLRKENIDKMETALNPNEKELWEYLKSIKYFAYETIKTEYNLSVKIDNHFFGGRLDALVKQDGKYFILDYKTGSAPKNAKYDFQTMIYLLSVKEFFQTNNVTFVYIDLRNKTEVEIYLTEELAQEYKQKLSNLAKEIETSEFNPKKDSISCPCEYNMICF